MKSNTGYLVFASIVVISFLQHYEHFSKDIMSIHSWRQTQTQSTIINFYEEDMNILNPRRNERGGGDGISRMEFPLMQWLVACVYKVFGNHLILTRLIMFGIGLCSVYGMYRLLLHLFQNTKAALIGAWAFNFSPCFYYYTINPMPDNLALCSSIAGMAFFFNWYRNGKDYRLILSGILLSLGALCKLPFILYYVVPLTWFALSIYQYGWQKKPVYQFLGHFIFLLFPLAWYLSVIGDWKGNGIVSGILDNQVPVATILDYLKHNLVSTLPELLLNYGSVPLFLSGFYFLFRNKRYKSRLFPLILVWSLAILSYFFYEINMIADVHDYYLFPFYPLLFMLVSYGAMQWMEHPSKWLRSFTILLLLLLPFTAYLRMKVRWNPDSPGFNKDLLLYKTELQAAVPKEALVIAGNDISHYIFFYYIDKKGWGFHNDQLEGALLKAMIDEGARYLYTDSRVFDSKSDIQPYLGQLILEKGSIRVYSLVPEIQ